MLCQRFRGGFQIGDLVLVELVLPRQTAAFTIVTWVYRKRRDPALGKRHGICTRHLFFDTGHRPADDNRRVLGGFRRKEEVADHRVPIHHKLDALFGS